MTKLNDNQVSNSITRNELVTNQVGVSVLAKILAGTGISTTWTGADVGTGDVTINVSTTINADTVDGIHANTTDVNNIANQLVRTNASGYSYFGWINTVSGDNSTNAITRIYASSDAFIRYYTLANFTSQILTQLKTIDGTTSGLDADLLDGLHSSSFVQTSNAQNITAKHTFSFGDGDVPFLLNVQGMSGVVTGFNSDYLGGKPASYFAISSHTHTSSQITNLSSASVGYATSAGNVNGYQVGQNLRTTDAPTFSKITSNVAVGTSPISVTSTTLCLNLNSQLLEGYHASAFALTTHIHSTLTTEITVNTTDGNCIFYIGNGVITSIEYV